MAMATQAGYEMIAVDAVDRRLPGGIDIGDDYRIRIVEAGAEFLEKRLQAGVAMRLHDGNDLAVARFRAAFSTPRSPRGDDRNRRSP